MFNLDEYCNAIDCATKSILDDEDKNLVEKHFADKDCDICMVNTFYHWLKENGYKIVG